MRLVSTGHEMVGPIGSLYQIFIVTERKKRKKNEKGTNSSKRGTNSPKRGTNSPKRGTNSPKKGTKKKSALFCTNFSHNDFHQKFSGKLT